MSGRAPLAIRVAALGLAAFAVGYPLRAALLSADVSVVVRVLVSAAFALSALRPGWRVPLLIGGVALAPIFPFLSPGVPRGIVHLVVIAITVPWWLEVARGRPVWPSRDPVAVVWAAWLLVGAWSVGVGLSGYRMVFEDDGRFLLELHRLASRYVFFRPTREIENWFRVWTAMADGLGAYLLVRASVDRDRALHVWMAAVGAVAAFGLLQAATGAALLKTWSTFDGVVRIHSTFADPNALAAWLALSLPPALVLAFIATGRSRRVWVATAVLVASALVFTGSRSGWGAALMGVARLAWHASRTGGGLTPHVARIVRRSLAAGAVLAAFVLAALVIVGTWRDVRQFDQQSYVDTLLFTFNLRQPPDEILKGRVLLWRTAGRMVASAPAFGVGLGRSEREFYSFSQYLDPRKPPGYTAHNTFLTVASETGLLGVTAFMVLLGTVAWAGRRSSADSAGTSALLGAALMAGLLAFVITMLTGDRLLLREDVVVLGIGIALAMRFAGPASPGTWKTASALALAVVACLVVTTPIRARAERRAVQLHRVWHGVGAVRSEPDGTRFRWTGGRATFYVPGTIDLLVVPMRRGASGPQHVTVRVNDRDADRLVLDDDQWREVRYAFPGVHSSRQFHRIEIIVNPLVDVRGEDEPVGVKLGVPRY